MSVSTTVSRGRSASLRLAARGAFGFTVLYLLHRIGQGLGPADSGPAAVAAYEVSHRGMLVASEIAVAFALLVFVLVPAGLVPVLWDDGCRNAAVALGVTSTVFVTLGFMSTAGETALANVTDEQSAVLAVNQLQGRIPIVWAFAAVAATIAWAVLRGGLAARWLGFASAAAAAVFLLGGVFSLLGATPEGRSSIYGIGLAIVWSLLLAVGLRQAARTRP